MNEIFLLPPFSLIGSFIFCLEGCSNHPCFISSQGSGPRVTMGCGKSWGRQRERVKLPPSGLGEWQEIFTHILPGPL